MKLDRSTIEVWALAGQIGCSIGVSLVVTIVGGLFLDSVLDTSPWFLLAGIFLGLVIAGYSLYRLTLIRTSRDGMGRGRHDKP